MLDVVEPSDPLAGGVEVDVVLDCESPLSPVDGLDGSVDEADGSPLEPVDGLDGSVDEADGSPLEPVDELDGSVDELDGSPLELVEFVEVGAAAPLLGGAALLFVVTPPITGVDTVTPVAGPLPVEGWLGLLVGVVEPLLELPATFDELLIGDGDALDAPEVPEPDPVDPLAPVDPVDPLDPVPV